MNLNLIYRNVSKKNEQISKTNKQLSTRATAKNSLKSLTIQNPSQIPANFTPPTIKKDLIGAPFKG